MTAKFADQHPDRVIALMALNARPDIPGQMLEEVVRYAFEQLCWRRSTNDLDALLAELAEVLTDVVALSSPLS
jgi:hypothetical protein